MNKEEFLEILADYLKKDFSVDEVNDILRDYEEYFVDGIIEGKSDMEIIEQLGSPKFIAKEFVAQIKEGKDGISKEQVINKEALNDKISVVKLRLFKMLKKCDKSLKNFLIRSEEKLTKSLTANIENENNSSSNTIVIRFSLILLTIVLLIPAVFVAFIIIFTLAILVVTLVLAVVFIPFALKFSQIIPETIGTVIFAYILFIGLQIFAWQIIIWIILKFKYLIKKYIHWFKRRCIYLRASKKKQSKYKTDNEKKEI